MGEKGKKRITEGSPKFTFLGTPVLGRLQPSRPYIPQFSERGLTKFFYLHLLPRPCSSVHAAALQNLILARRTDWRFFSDELANQVIIAYWCD